MEHDFGVTQVAFYLSDGTTARRGFQVPENEDDANFVWKTLREAKGSYLQVESMDIQVGRVAPGGLFILADHVVAFTVS